MLSNKAVDTRARGRDCVQRPELVRRSELQTKFPKLVKGEQRGDLFASKLPSPVCLTLRMSFLGVDEDKIVEQLKPELQKLVDAVTGLASTLALATIICAIVYIYRQLKEERRAKEYHSRRMMAE